MATTDRQAMTAEWPATRARIIDAFDGELPGAHLEAEMIDIYEASPNAIINAIESVATSLHNGKINSGWAVLKKAAATKATQQTNPTVTRERAIANAKQWMHNAGLIYDRWSEVEDELFGDRGRLKQWRTTKTRDILHALWLELRPAGEQTEREEVERADQWKATRAELEQTKKTTDPAELRRRALILSGVEPHLEPLAPLQPPATT